MRMADVAERRPKGGFGERDVRGSEGDLVVAQEQHMGRMVDGRLPVVCHEDDGGTRFRSIAIQ